MSGIDGIRAVAAAPSVNSQDGNALYRLRKYGELKLDDEGRFSQPGKYWSIDMRQMKRLRDLGVARIDRVGQSTFAVAVREG